MTIVVGIDGSEDSREALRWTLVEAKLRGTAVDAVYVWSLPYLGVAYAWAPALDQGTIDALRDTAQTVLDRTVDSVVGVADDVDVRRHVVEGSPAAVLVERASDAELLVVGSRGLGGFRELLLGSVGHQCAQHARCPVVVIPHTGSPNN